MRRCYLAGRGLVGGFFLGSFYLPSHQGYSALHTGLSFLPAVAAAVLGAHAASRLDGRALASSAVALAAAGAAVAADWLAEGSPLATAEVQRGRQDPHGAPRAH